MDADSSFVPKSQAGATVLPPCRVCGQKSSGFHYGANTCEACKGFFRRILKRKRPINFQCVCKDKDKVSPESEDFVRTNNCPLCRYNRCLAVGMSREGIKIGRYTLKRKSENIREVKRIEAGRKEVKSDSIDEALEDETKAIEDFTLDTDAKNKPRTPSVGSNNEPINPFALPYHNDLYSKELTYPINGFAVKDGLPPRPSSSGCSLDTFDSEACYSDSSSGVFSLDASPEGLSFDLVEPSPPHVSSSQTIPGGATFYNADLSDSQIIPCGATAYSTDLPGAQTTTSGATYYTTEVPGAQATTSGVTSYTAELPETSSDEMDMEEMEQLIDIMKAAQDEFSSVDPCKHHDTENLSKRQKEYAEEYKLKTNLFGRMDLSTEEHQRFLRTTGIDLDNRQLYMLEFLSFLEKKIVKYIGFAKCIPGFDNLPINDKANLIKSSRAEFAIFGYYRTMDPDLNVTATLWGRTMHVDELSKVMADDNKNFVKRKFEFARKLKKLNLTPYEEAVIRGVVLTFTDRCQLEQPQKVEEIQRKLVSCLQYMVKKRDNGSSSRLHQIFAILTDLREFSEIDNKLIRNLSVLETHINGGSSLIREFVNF